MTIDDVKIAIIEVDAHVSVSNLNPNLKHALFEMLQYFDQELDRLEHKIKDIQGE